MTFIVLISITGHMIIAGIYNYVLLVLLYSSGLRQEPQLVIILHLVGGPKPSLLKGLDH